MVASITRHDTTPHANTHTHCVKRGNHGSFGSKEKGKRIVL